MNDTQVHRRLDGRLANEIRPFASEQGGLFRADGSARMSHGNTAVLVAVYGPGTAKARRMEQSDKAVIDVCFKLEKGLTTSKEKEYEAVIRKTFEPIVLLENFPRAVISIVVQVIEDDGSLLSVAINATNLALMDAGIPMTGMVTSTTCAILQDGNLCLDPSSSEEEQALSIVMNASSSTSDDLLTSITSGLLNEEQYFACAEANQRATDSVLAFVRIAQQNKYKP